MPSTRPVELRAEIGLRCWSGTGNLMPQSHRHNDLEINLVERGQFIYLFGGKRIYIGAGQIALFWAAMPHQLIEIAPETYAHWLTLPLAWFLQRGFAAHLIQPLLEGVPQISDARPNDMAALAQWREDLSLPSDDRLCHPAPSGAGTATVGHHRSRCAKRRLAIRLWLIQPVLYRL